MEFRSQNQFQKIHLQINPFQPANSAEVDYLFLKNAHSILIDTDTQKTKLNELTLDDLTGRSKDEGKQKQLIEKQIEIN